MGTAVGALFFAFFGALWVFAGFAMQHRAPAALLAALIAVVITLVLLASLIIRRTSKPAKAADPQRRESSRRVFRNANIAQYSAIALVIVVANIIHRPQIILPSVMVIVGLHFLPFAIAFRYFPHFVTGVAMIVWAFLYPHFGAAGFGNPSGPFGAGVIILASAAVSLIAAFRRLRTI